MATVLVHLAVRVLIDVEATTEEEAQEQFYIMPDSDVKEAIAKSAYFDIDTCEILNTEV